MQTSSVRYVQHHLADVLKRVEAGEQVKIMRRNIPVAMIVPLPSSANSNSTSNWDEHDLEIKKIFNNEKVAGTPMSEIISDARGEY
jgi:antitoxin (DNA-binding transcriptional repressor) of toxin-antitoxin stability system